MVDAALLLQDLKRLLRNLEVDLRDAHADSDANRALQAEWQAARDAGRTGEILADFRKDALTQAAVHWILGCVFLRFLEDNGLVERPWLAGPGGRLHLARDRHDAYFRARPHDSDLEYLLACFDEAAALPGMAGLFDRRHNPLFRLPLSGDGAMALLAFFQNMDPDTGRLVHDFTDPDWSTRFLGDLYQDLSEAARKRYALLQTPEFVEAFILERTLDPAIREFGFREVRMIDPACGSGHFLLGGFARLLAEWQRHEPGRNPRDQAQKALDAIAGVDLNPFATEIARFRLLLAALRASDIQSLRGAPDFRINVATGDSLLHGRHFKNPDLGHQVDDATWGRVLKHVYQVEDAQDLARILGRQYHAVVGNPPYITPKDPAMRSAYRELYASCHMKYALAVPFIERFFDLALDGRTGPIAGYVGLIVANSFMKREFGKKLIEQELPRLDLSYVVDTSGAYIPGHGTPTAILFGRNRAPVAGVVRTVMGIKGEPATPDDPARGEVWSAILRQIDRVDSESEFVSVADTPRDGFAGHPWSIGGGGASDLKAVLDDRSAGRLGETAQSIGFGVILGVDDAFEYTGATLDRKKVAQHSRRPFVIGDYVEDWTIRSKTEVVFPYDDRLQPTMDKRLEMLFWPLRQLLWCRNDFSGKSYKDMGRTYYEYHQFPTERYKTRGSIVFPFVSTHSSYVFDSGESLFNKTSPIIKLISNDRAHGVVGLLNSSTASFWMKQVFFNKGAGGGTRVKSGRSPLGDEAWESHYEHDGTKLGKFPLAEPYPLDQARRLDSLAQTFAYRLPPAVVEQEVPTRAALDSARREAESARAEMIALQEELDWRCYRLYGLTDQNLEHPAPPPLQLGERAFEIVMARKMAAGELETAWFERHRSTPITELPAHWPDDYRKLVERRIELIENDRFISLIERPEYKRRWALEPWEKMEEEALKRWLQDRLEAQHYWSGEPALRSTNRLADLARSDAEFMQVAEVYTSRPDFDVAVLVRDLAIGQSVPFLPVLRYNESGLRKRAEWERTWELQRQEDAIDARTELPEDDPVRLTPNQAKALKAKEVGDIPVPPKYKGADFQKTDYWRLRGALDVPKERFVSYPFCEREADGSPVVSWAGHDHLQQARAIAHYYLERKEREGWSRERLLPLLAGLRELLPWLRQWHNAYDRAMGARMGDYFAEFVRDEARALGFNDDELAAWTPPARPGRRGRRPETREAAE
jgi:hypothetical protein